MQTEPIFYRGNSDAEEIAHARAVLLTLQTDLAAARVVIQNQANVIEQRDRESERQQQEHAQAEHALCLRVSELSADVRRERAKLVALVNAVVPLLRSAQTYAGCVALEGTDPSAVTFILQADEMIAVLEQQIPL